MCKNSTLRPITASIFDVKTLLILISTIFSLALGSCSLVTVPVKIAGKVVTTSVGLAGKAAGAGIDAMKKDNKDEEPKAEEVPE